MKKCWSCRFYKAYYIKGNCGFNRIDHGKCIKLDKEVDKHESCDNWYSNAVGRRIRKAASLKALDAALSDIAELKQILSEEYEENKLIPLPKKL